jgi:hypothetical protein
MPFIPAPLCARVEMHMSNAGQQIENVWHVQSTGAEWDVTSLALLADTFATWFSDTFRPCIPSSVWLVDVKATALHSADADTYTSVLNSGVTGTGANPLPNNVSFAVHKVCAGRGRSNQGRVYLPAVSRDEVVATNQINATFAGVLVAAFSALRDAVAAASTDWFLAVVSFFTANAPRAAGVPAAILYFVARDLILDTQRRRLPGRGR